MHWHQYFSGSFPQTQICCEWPNPNSTNKSQFSCRNSFFFRLLNCGGAPEDRYWSVKINERKWPEQMNFGGPNYRNHLSPSKSLLHSAVLHFENKKRTNKRWLIDLLRFEVCFCVKILLELLLLSWCLSCIFFPNSVLFEVRCYFTLAMGIA